MRATSSSAARTASVTSSSRVGSRTAAWTWGGVGALTVRSVTSPVSFRRASARSRRWPARSSRGGEGRGDVHGNRRGRRGGRLASSFMAGTHQVDAAADGLRGLPVRQAMQELQHTDGSQLGRREPRPPVARVPVGEARRATASRGGLSPTSCPSEFSTAQPARSKEGLAHRSGEGRATRTSPAGSDCTTAMSLPADHAAVPGSPEVPVRANLGVPVK